MNEEHFLTELKIYLRTLSNEQTNQILQTYHEIFAEQKETGLSEESISKVLGKPREIAQKILAEFDLTLENGHPTSHSWKEFNPSSSPRAVTISDAVPEDRMTKWLKRIGLIAFNLFIMFWLWLSASLVILIGWVLTVLGLAIFGAGLLSIAHNPDIIGLFPLSIGLLFLGLSLLGLILMPYFTLYFFRFTRDYIHWHLKFFRKGGRTS